MGSAGASITTVIFDYGEVLSLPPSTEARATLERLAGVPATDFWSVFWDERREYDRGCTAAQYWGRVARRLGADWDPALRQWLWATDVGSWLATSDESAHLLDRLAARGVRLALLSNAPHDIAGALRHSPALASFDSLFFSCDLGICKADPAAYTHFLRELGATPEETVFVDDREENVLAAEQLGIDAHHYCGHSDLEAFLTDRIGPV